MSCTLIEGKKYESSARGVRHRESDVFMKRKNRPELDDDLRAEYDFSTLGPGVRGKYYKRYRAGKNLVLLDPDVARAFPTDEAVNEALRLLVRISKTKTARSR